MAMKTERYFLSARKGYNASFIRRVPAPARASTPPPLVVAQSPPSPAPEVPPRPRESATSRNARRSAKRRAEWLAQKKAIGGRVLKLEEYTAAKKKTKESNSGES